MINNCTTRWLLRRDVDEVLSIEKSCFKDPWCENDFILCLRKHECVGMVLEDSKKNIIGYMVHEFNQHKIEILNFAIDPNKQRQGYGTHLLQVPKNRLKKKQREFLSIKVLEENLKAQLFFQNNGFIATNILKNYWENGDNTYLMRFFSKPEFFMAPDHPFFPTNRISQYIIN